MKAKHILSILFLVGTFAIFSCDKHIPPHIEFKTGVDYTSSDTTVTQGDTITVGIIAQKKEDEMKTYNISYAYDGASSTTTKETFSLSGAQQEHYEKDYSFVTRNLAGTEKWTFTITDRDGNIAKKSIILTVN